MLTINEIFYSIQGESTRAGQPCVFVRLTACDLRCSWCDTPYAFHEGSKRTLDEVVADVERYGCQLVEITGGEPLLQDDVYPLMRRLRRQRPDGAARNRRAPADRRRSGRSDQDRRRQVPGERRVRQERLEQSRRAVAARRSEVRHPGSPRLRVRRRRRAAPWPGGAMRGGSVLAGARRARIPRTLSEWMLADSVPARLQVQLHKYIWPPSTRGV